MARILIVDDARLQRSSLSNLVRDEGHQPVVAANGTEALQIVQQETPDCIISDLTMPEMGGLELLATLRDRGVDLPVVIVTADVQHTTREQCLRLGAAGILNKPVRSADLREKLQHILTNG